MENGDAISWHTINSEIHFKPLRLIDIACVSYPLFPIRKYSKSLGYKVLRSLLY